MSHYNVFAVLTPYDEQSNALTAFDLPHNVKRFRKKVGSVAKVPTIDSREPTPGLTDRSTSENESVGGIVLTFDEEVKDPNNRWQFGTRPSTSDVLLGYRGTEGISAKHCNLTIDDDEHCIWLPHYNSTHGTAVGYDDQKKDEVRRKETWILSYRPGPDAEGLGKITIHVGELIYKIEFPNHRAAHSQYIKNLQAFIKKRKNAAPPFEVLGLDIDPPTQKPSQAHTPSAYPIYLDKEVIGKGAFGEVGRVIKLRDGKYFAAKYFIPAKSKGHKKSDRKRKQDESNKIDETYKAWLEQIRKEFTIMQNNPHPNIVRVIDFIETPEPALIMELYPLGNIRDVGVPYDQYITVFAQILFGLSHLHKNRVAHRDLKPENFLVKKKPFTIAITDFGLSKIKDDDNVLKTFCGTLKYLAPETFPGVSDSGGYGPEVDIWSAGVIMLEWMYNIPNAPTIPTPKRKDLQVTKEQWCDWVTAWVELLLEKLGDQEVEDKVVKILLGMIEPDPKKRWSADQCLKRGLESGLFRMATEGRIVGVNDPDEEDDEDKDDSDDGTKIPMVSSVFNSALLS
ncbi:hypothetical protein MMC17_009374 [Xylographa soralifera]|nr:hypothetical protein [Xylographa soralifera]